MPAGRRAGNGQDDAGQVPGALASTAMFRRIQFTPDLLPADITGSSFYNPDDGVFDVPRRAGLRQCRAGRRDQPHSPRTQSALLEVMSEGAGHGRRAAARPAAAVLRDRHAEPDRLSRHLPPARSAAGPVRRARHARLPRLCRRDGDFVQPERSRSVRRPAPVVLRGSARCRSRSRRCAWTAASPNTCCAWWRLTRADPRLRLGVSPRGSLTLYRTAQARALTGRPRLRAARRHPRPGRARPGPPHDAGHQSPIRRHPVPQHHRGSPGEDARAAIAVPFCWLHSRFLCFHTPKSNV